MTEEEYIVLSQATREVSHFVSIIKEIEFVLKLQKDTPTVLCSLLQEPLMPVTVYEDNQGAIAIAVSL